MTSVVSIQIEKNLAFVNIDYPPVNATSVLVRQGLMQAVKTVSNSAVSTAILTCSGKTFIAGGDMSEFDATPLAPHLPDVINAIENNPVPWIAAMHGHVLGGGFELAMGCTFRIAVAGTKFGLPEVNVGLIPGAGGTQRLPRLIGSKAAIDLCCTGAPITAEALHAFGGIDHITHDNLSDAAITFAQTITARPMAVSQRNVARLSAEFIKRKAVEIKARAKGQTAPLDNLKAVAWAGETDFTTGLARERALHMGLRASAQSRALRHAFFAERAVAKPAVIKGITPREISHIAIVGGGLMGAGIAAACLAGGFTVTMIEQDQDAAKSGVGRVKTLIDGALQRGKISGDKHVAQLARFTASDCYDAASTADLAIEAVFEDLAVKRDVFKSLAKVMSKNAVLATNTSYLDPQEIFEGTPNLSRCVGLHFFSPAHIMKLLEIVKTPDTAPEVLATGFVFGKKLRKIGVLAGICDGFIGNRMLSAYRRQADYLLADGCLPYEIDAAMRAFGMPMGPYELQDLTGLQIAWANRKRQAKARNPAERYVPIGDQLCEMGRLGQRSDMGWYSYTKGSRKPMRDPEVEALINAITPRQKFTRDEITNRMLAALINEGALIVEQGIAERSLDVDMVQIHGYGFPRWRGGPMQYARETGVDKIAQWMGEISEQSSGSWEISRYLT
ncbi:MAG: 3-hydroxyacyl-CoA dehydrogenase NAD-binding domain-containing protein [Paracoccaceae bacterium]